MRIVCILVALCVASPAFAASDEHVAHAEERESLGTATSFRPTSSAAREAMANLLCQCPGCQAKRITILDCACSFAATQREQVLATLAGGEDVRADQIARYGEGVIAAPATSIVWLLPVLLGVAGFGLVLALGGRRTPRPAAPTVPEDIVFADRLDDELALTSD